MATAIVRLLNIRALCLALSAIFVTLIIPSRLLAADASACPAEPEKAIVAARTAINANSSEGKDHALHCLIEAVAALDTKIEGIRTGAIPLKGFVDARGGLLACASPVGNAGEMIYNADYNTVQFCDSTSWISMSGTVATESDPQVGAVTNNQWCRGNGTSVECDQAAPSATPTADSLDFTEFKDLMTLDASTDIAASGTNMLSVTNTGTGNSFLVNDAASDSSPFVIDAAGNVGIGTTTTGMKAEIAQADSSSVLLSEITIRRHQLPE